MSQVVSKIPGKWKWFGIELEIPEAEYNFDGFPNSDNKECFMRVLTSWRKCAQPRYTWETVLDVLQSDILNEQRLAMEVRSALMSRNSQSVSFSQGPEY